MSTDQHPSNRDAHRWTVFGTICLVYFFVYFHRVSTSVIVTDLLNAFKTNATALGFMSSMYFYVYAFEQPVVGYLTDRLGPRRVISYWSLVAAGGCFLFGLAPGIGWACAGRALIGIGVGGVYVPALKALSLWFEKKEFTGMLGLLMSAGNLGAVIATTPLAWVAGAWGWRPTFFLIGAITLGLAVITFLTIKEKAPASLAAEPDAGSAGARSNILHVMASGQFWIIAFIFTGIYGTFVTLQGLWATPFLMTALNIERIVASKLNMLIPVGVIIGAPLFGWLSDRYGIDKRHILIVILATYSLTWVGIIFYYAQLGTVGLALVQLLMGLVGGGFISILWGFVRETTPSRILGLTTGLMNPAPILGVAIFQVITGAILDRYEKIGDLYPIQGFKSAFLVCLLVSVLCLGLSFCIRKSKAGDVT